MIEWSAKKDRVAIKLLELENGKWLHTVSIDIGDSHSSGPLCIRHDSAANREDAVRDVQSRLFEICAKGELSGLKGKALNDFRDFVIGLIETDERKVA